MNTKTKRNQITAFDESNGLVFGTYHSLSAAYVAVRENVNGDDIPNASRMAFRIRKNGTIVARTMSGALSIETGAGGSRSFNWLESLDVNIGSKDTIVDLSLEAMGLYSRGEA